MIRKVFSAGLLSVAMCSSLFAATIYVGPTDTYTTLHDAYNVANSGDQIVVRNGNITTQGFAISKEITITTDGLVRTVNFSNTDPISIYNDDVSFHNLKFTGYNSTQAYVIYVNYLISGFYMENCEITGSAQKGIFDYGSVSNAYHSLKINSTSTGFYGEDVQAMFMMGPNSQFNNPDVNIDSRRTINVSVGFWLYNGVSLSSGYGNGSKCLNFVNPDATNSSGFCLEGVSLTSVGPGAYPIYLDGVNDAVLLAADFNYCPTVAWQMVNGTSNVSEGSINFNSCSHP